MFNQAVHILVVKVAFDERDILRRFLFHLVFEEHLEQRQILDDSIDFVAVERQGFFQFVEDADKIQDKPVRLDHFLLFIFIRPVHARNRLQSV